VGALVTLLAGCGEGSSFDSGFKDGFRNKFVSSCAISARSNAPPGVTVDFDRICSCTADKVMANKSTSEIMSYQPGEDAKTMAVQCMAEQGIGPRIGS